MVACRRARRLRSRLPRKLAQEAMAHPGRLQRPHPLNQQAGQRTLHGVVVFQYGEGCCSNATARSAPLAYQLLRSHLRTGPGARCGPDAFACELVAEEVVVPPYEKALAGTAAWCELVAEGPVLEEAIAALATMLFVGRGFTGIDAAQTRPLPRPESL
ncbi:unnamed protein product [Symbiodinium necroappetens]|uniref:Uncharacterized protein n=1 Tax=Symbiodinium necroappetens TaxID=1628268 RepID=A0A813BN71_9DINO|nr:unnamed protein product [Symbiodinium necroappetens]